MAEGVGDVPLKHYAAELPGEPRPVKEVPHQGFPGHQELVRLYVPRPDEEPSLADVSLQELLPFGADLQVIKEGDDLAVQGEPVAGVGSEQGDDPVQCLYQVKAEFLEAQVPFPIPVRMRHHDYASFFRCHPTPFLPVSAE